MNIDLLTVLFDRVALDAPALLLLARLADPEGLPHRPSAVIYGLGGLSLLLVIMLRALMPQARATLRSVFVMLLAWGVATAVWAIPREPSGLREWAELLSLVLMSLVLVRVGWMFVMEWLLRGGELLGLSKIWQDVVKAVIYVVTAVAAARAAGADPRTLAATGGLVTAALTFSMQQTLGDLVAGVLLQGQAPFKVGDWIAWNDNPAQIGRVVEINWRATKVTTLDRVEITVPNSLLAKSPIVNYSEPILASRRSVYFHVGIEIPPPMVVRIAEEAARGAEGVLETPPVSCVPLEFSDRGVRYWLRFFIEDMGNRDAIDGGVRTRIWYAFKRAAVPFAFPRLDAQVLPDAHAAAEEIERAEVERREAAMRRVDLLQPLSAEDRRSLARRARTQGYARGEAVVRAGEHGSEMYFVASGRLAVVSADGATVFDSLGPNDFFGEMALLTGEPRSATVRALEDCVLYVIDRAAFDETIAGNQAVLAEISRIVAERRSERVARESGVRESTEQREERQKTLLSLMLGLFGR